MDLHRTIETYFDADGRSDRDLLTRVFAPDAAVVDEGRTHVGREAIGEWWVETKARYRTVLEPLEASHGEGATLVRTRVTGTFPGSPTTLTFAFRLRDDLVSALEISA